MSIFIRSNNKSELQKQLDRDQEQQNQSCCGQHHDCCHETDKKPLFPTKANPQPKLNLHKARTRD